MSWNLDCDLCVSWSFLQNNNHQAVNKMKGINFISIFDSFHFVSCLMIVVL